MENQDRFRQVLIGLGAPAALLLVATLVFTLLGNTIAAAVAGTISVATVLVISHVGVFYAGAQYTRGAMAMGAGIALKAQEVNDKWDQVKTVTFGKLITEGARLGRQASTTQDSMPVLPLPSQGLDWLPTAAAFDVDEESWQQ